MTFVFWGVQGQAALLIGLTILIPAIPYTMMCHVPIAIIPGGLSAVMVLGEP